MKKLLPLLVLVAIQWVYPQDFWKQLSGPPAGRINCFSHDYLAYVYAGTQDNGIFRSSDKGNTWTPIGFSGNPILSLTQESNFVFVSTAYSGVLRSSNKGAQWTSLHVGSSSSPKKLLINNFGDLFAGADDGIYRTEDDGDTWAPINTGLTDRRILDVAVNSGNQLFVSTFRSGVFRSDDNGDSWQQVINGLGSARVRAMTVDPAQNIYAGTENNGIFISTDNGDTWIQIFKYGGWPSLDTDYLGTLYALSSTGTLLLTLDNGSAWRSAGTENLRSQPAVISINSDGSILAGSGGGGIYKAPSYTSAWVSVGLKVSYPTAFRQTADGAFIACTINGFASGGGCYITRDNGASWQPTGLTGYRLYSMEKQESGTLITGGPDGIFRSTDNGINWSPLNTGANPNQLSSIIAGIPNFYFAAVGPTGLLRSNDDGVSWSTSGLTGVPITSLSSDIGGTIYACTPQGLYRSTNNGVPWTLLPITSGIDTTTAFIRAGDRMITATNAFVYSSTDGGATWDPSASTAAVGIVRAFCIYNTRELFAATSKGVFESTDSGATWTSLNSGMLSTNIVSIGFDQAGYIYAGSADFGIFRSNQIITDIKNPGAVLPVGFALYQNYPNPFNPSTTISFEVPERSHVLLKLFNLLGEETATLVNDFRNAGRYGINFNANGLPSGVYIYKFTAGSYTDQRKMLLIR
jgi:photosystem II stability/assembly factor-like uncharacterized protein